MCDGGSLHSISPVLTRRTAADNQAHDQQADAGPTAGERGIQASQHVPRPDYSSWRRELKHPTGRRV